MLINNMLKQTLNHTVFTNKGLRFYKIVNLLLHKIKFFNFIFTININFLLKSLKIINAKNV